MTDTTNTSETVTAEELSTMESFFQRISTTVVAHSQQVRELGIIRQELDSITLRVNAMEIENGHLRKDLSQAWEHAERLRTEKEQALKQRDEAIADAQHARAELAYAKQDHEQHVAAVTDTVNARDNRIKALEANVLEVSEDRAKWVSRSNNWETVAKQADTRLNKVMGEFNALANRVKSLFEPPVQEVPKDEPSVADEAQQAVQVPRTVGLW